LGLWQSFVRDRFSWTFLLRLDLLLWFLAPFWLLFCCAAELCVNLSYGSWRNLGQIWVHSQPSSLLLHLLHGLDVHISDLLLNERLLILLLLQLLLLVRYLLSLLYPRACLWREELSLLTLILLAGFIAILVSTKVLLLAPSSAALTRFGHHTDGHACKSTILFVKCFHFLQSFNF
jgi:hypothetical protein